MGRGSMKKKNSLGNDWSKYLRKSSIATSESHYWALLVMGMVAIKKKI
jgi:hypothetical protein